MIKFNEKNHSYQNIDNTHSPWVSVTSLVGIYKPPFDAPAQALKSSKNPRSKWYGMDPAEIQRVWKSEGERSTTDGHKYHSIREDQLTTTGHLHKDGIIYNISKPIIQGEDKLSPTQKLYNNTIYPEHLVYSSRDYVCGQADKVEVHDNRVNITDYKTVKVLNTEGYMNWEGITKRMLPPLEHLDDCHLVHYTLQLSLYLYMILRHNPQLLPGDLTIEHIWFQVASTDQYGYPTYARDSSNNFIIESIKNYKVPYLKPEVLAILSDFKTNFEKYLPKLKK